MAEKKRKVADSTTSSQAVKKAKKNTKPEGKKVSNAEASEIITATIPNVDTVPAAKKKARKRAADFLDNEPETTLPEKNERPVGNGVVEPASLTADGVNGVVEHSDDEDITITTSKQPKRKSMMAEAERTQDQEMEDEFGKGDEEDEQVDIDAAPALLTGFDSESEDLAEDKSFDASKVQPIPQFKKTSRKLRKAKETPSDGPGVVYIGRIPHGFYESQMREYFAQFGDISRLRLSRSKKTGASKHFAFVEFTSDEVAKIVAETMDNYLMFGHILKCKYAPEGSLHPDVWKGANKKFRKIPHHKLARQKAEQPKTDEQIAKKMKKEQAKRVAKVEKLKQIGYEFELPKLKKPEERVQVEDEQKQPAIEDKVEGAIVPPPTVPKDELATKVEDDAKKSKKPKQTKAPVAAEKEASVKVPSKSKGTKEKPLPAKKDKQLKGILKKPKRA
ncbi:nucleolar protein [Lithohypha guttulata]|uniref:Nucleolar protein n=1 Tax=Lithohypha guttulata TaxID=1690604 RepID=A0AAN7T724_9EURO|nr:nucleolar protein [Lithohypha guttulata]KAK5104266.1 nucleolar protein [Lithohypha guttulata]